MAIERRLVSYAGRVQNVGFRMTARRVARGFSVSGYVRNLPDGRVELVAEGEARVVDAFLAAVRSAMGDLIRSETADLLPPGEPPFKEFSIRF
jgi:acylphosphatase